jgi:hypothetical protein
MVDWSEVGGELVTQVLRIMIPVLIALILKWAGDLVMRIKESQPQLYWALSEAAEIGYAVAEEYFRGQKVDGREKLNKAIDHAVRYLSEFGLKVDETTVKDAIISYGTTNKLFNWTKEKSDAVE